MLFRSSIFFETYRYIITVGIHAVGKVRIISLWTGSFLLANPIIIYIVFKIYSLPDYTYISIILVNFIIGILDVLLLKHYVSQISAFRLLGSMLVCVGLLFAGYAVDLAAVVHRQGHVVAERLADIALERGDHLVDVGLLTDELAQVDRQTEVVIEVLEFGDSLVDDLVGGLAGRVDRHDVYGETPQFVGIASRAERHPGRDHDGESGAVGHAVEEIGRAHV